MNNYTNVEYQKNLLRIDIRKGIEKEIEQARQEINKAKLSNNTIAIQNKTVKLQTLYDIKDKLQNLLKREESRTFVFLDNFFNYENRY